jgi:Uma2 family endonuclease
MNVAIPTAADGPARRAFTVDDVARMIGAGILGEDERFELVEGDIVMMAAKGIAHERIKSALLVAIARTLPDDLTMGVEVTLRLTDMTMLEPDIAVFPKALFRKSSTGFARLEPGEARLVIEVAVSSLAYDRGLKAKIYAHHRVQEFWVIDATKGITWVHTGPAGDGWTSIVKYGPQDALTTPALTGLSVTLHAID